MKRGHARPDLDPIPFLREVAERVAASTDGDAAMAAVVAGVTGAVDAHVGCVFVREPDGGLRLGAAHGRGRPGYARLRVAPGHRDPIAAALATCEEQRCDDYLTSEGWLTHAVALEEPWRSAWFAPLCRGGRALGVIGAIRRRVEPFDDEECDLLRTLAAHAAIALDGAQRAEALGASRARALRTLGALAARIEMPATPDELLALLGEVIGTHASARRAAFWPLRSDGTAAPETPAVARAAWERGGVVRSMDALAMPWRAGERELGALVLQDPVHADGFTEDDAWIAQLSGLAAALVWQQRQSTARLLVTEREEAGRARAQGERVAALEKVKSHILSLASHELATPVTLIRGYLSLMADGTIRTDPPAATFVPALLTKVNQMSLLITEMLETARLEEGRIELRLAERDLRQVVRDAVDGLRPTISERHRIVLDEDPEPVTAVLDTGRVNTIIANLLDNAVKYSPTGGPVEISVRREGSHAAVSVSDRGLGIAAADISGLFRRFGRVLTAETSHIAGTGLGLYLCRELALVHRGQITVHSQPGLGSAFTLLLPGPGGETVDGERPASYDLRRLGVHGMLRCCAELQRRIAAAGTMEDAAGAVVRHLYESLSDERGPRAAPLVCFFRSLAYAELPADLRRLADAQLRGIRAWPDLPCIALVASAGDLPPWNSRRTSVADRVVAMADDGLRRSPMLAELVAQLGVSAPAARRGGVFHVANAAGGRDFPAGELARTHRVRSALGFGGQLSSGELYAVVALTRCPVTREQAELLGAVAPAVQGSLEPLLGGPAWVTR